LEAAVTAAITMSAPLIASPAEVASRTPSSPPAARRFAPPDSGNRTSQAAMVVTPAVRRPDAKAWPASPKPMKQSRGVLRVMAVPSRAVPADYEIRSFAASKAAAGGRRNRGTTWRFRTFGPQDQPRLRARRQAVSSHAPASGLRPRYHP